MELDDKELKERVDECIKNLLKRAEIRKKIRPEPDRIAQLLWEAADLLEQQKGLIVLLEKDLGCY